MKRRSVARQAALAGLAALLATAAWTVPSGGGAGAATPQGTIYGEGGDAVGPVMVRLLHDDASDLDPEIGSYTNVDLDQGIADFIGSAPGTFAADFAVSERPLTTAEAATAAANGRSFAYVPFVASPVALMTLVPNSTYTGSQTITPTQYCQHIPLSLDQLDGIYGTATPTYSSWGDSRLSCTSSPSTPADALHFGRWANLDPSMENFALMSLLDSTTASQAAFGAGLATAQGEGQAATSNPAASEHWPYSGTAITGGDEATLGKLIGLDPRSGAPSPVASLLQLGAIMPVTSVWTGDPHGVPWNLPTAAVQNAAGAYVAPSATAAEAAEAAATFDPTTNLVSLPFTVTNNATAYNNYLMLESYLVVPTNGLSADKALALAQFIRFAVGSTGQADIAALGAAPATAAMVKADLAVAQQLDAEAAAAPASTTTTTTTTTSGSTTSTTVASSTSGTGAGGSSSTGTSPTSATTAGSTSSGLAVTGDNPVPLAVLGLALLVCGESARRILRRRRART
jgi:ABC-type phosphate transport system substrate-binding protein